MKTTFWNAMKQQEEQPIKGANLEDLRARMQALINSYPLLHPDHDEHDAILTELHARGVWPKWGGLEIRTRKEEAADRDDYGQCAITGKKFGPGEDSFRITLVRNFQSQGLPSEMEGNSFEVCWEAFNHAGAIKSYILNLQKQ